MVAGKVRSRTVHGYRLDLLGDGGDIDLLGSRRDRIDFRFLVNLRRRRAVHTAGRFLSFPGSFPFFRGFCGAGICHGGGKLQEIMAPIERPNGRFDG